MSELALFAQNNGGGGIAALIILVVQLAICIAVVAGMWKVFVKAGKPGWAVIVPIYNIIVMLEIVGRPVWWIILMLIPFVNIVVGIVIGIDMAKSFGKGTGFGIGLAFLGIIFYPVLGFGDAEYVGPVAKEA